MEKPLRMLFVGNKPADIEYIRGGLGNSGFSIEVIQVEKAREFIACLEQTNWDVIISNYQSVDFNALTALELVAEKELDVPFIVYSDSVGEEAVVSVLKAGAHDYILREHSARLVPAIERELRNAQSRRARLRAEKVRDGIV